MHERWRDEATGVSIEYPYAWIEREAEPPTLLHASSRDLAPEVRVFVVEEPWWLPLFLATRAAATRLSSLGRDIEVTSSTSDRLSDGTRVNVGEVRWVGNVGPGVALPTLLLSAFHDGRWVIVNVTTGATGGPFPEDLRAIAYSLRFE
jgi:hypothetical protein